MLDLIEKRVAELKNAEKMANALFELASEKLTRLSKNDRYHVVHFPDRVVVKYREHWDNELNRWMTERSILTVVKSKTCLEVVDGAGRVGFTNNEAILTSLIVNTIAKSIWE